MPNPSDNESRGETEGAECDIKALWGKLEPLISRFPVRLQRDIASAQRTSRLISQSYHALDDQITRTKCRAIRDTSILRISFAQAMKPLISLVLGGHFSYGLFMQLCQCLANQQYTCTAVKTKETHAASIPTAAFPGFIPMSKGANIPAQAQGCTCPGSRLDSSLEHEVERTGKQIGCTWCLHINYMRQRKPVCLPILRPSLIQWNCKACKVPLCPPHSRSTWWEDFHSWVE
ncbi:uncharacterized protein P174DRAFT_300531 [Aspergillus novofumigatus IBT 16806]|uniref:Uncharacterized protein n=1 Tax=Aspergillus novofumigatus (strain IBT 16806) TaxID=1392255 RepID=A0A2I1BVY9_ASPN1|nr:uncharacterized protein P174DRAFT_300531 [Aspergillus novofumigatus IBT 16806]PKX89549.1 hypothetical protein P174DRAFT_300531 [Aspergillus novofumigatus IBT 16806]